MTFADIEASMSAAAHAAKQRASEMPWITIGAVVAGSLVVVGIIGAVVTKDDPPPAPPVVPNEPAPPEPREPEGEPS